jgi:hypothetical protein
MLTAEMKASGVEICQPPLLRYEKEGEEFLHNIVTADETWVHHYEPKSKCQPMEYHHTGSPVKENTQHPGFSRESHGYSFLGRR